MIWGIVIFALTLIVKLVFDLKQHNSGKPINHKLEAVFVAVALTGASFLAGWKSAPMFFFGFWVLFDGLFAVLIGQSFFYVGTTSALDKLQRKYPFLRVVKYVLFVGSVVTFIVI